MEVARTNMPVSDIVKSGYQARRRLNAAIKIQKLYRGYQAEQRRSAAIKIQKLYRGYQTRRNLADCTVAVELLWQNTLSDTQRREQVVDYDIERDKHIVSLLQWAGTKQEMLGQLSSDELALQHCLEAIDPLHRFSKVMNLHFYHRIWDWYNDEDSEFFLERWKFDSNKIGSLKKAESLFTIGKPEFGELSRDTTIATENGISKLRKAWKTGKRVLQDWLEVIDPRHRDGRNLNSYFQIWINISSDQPFFYWLDVGDGKTLNQLACSRKNLRDQRIKCLEPNEREAHKVIVKEGKLVYLQSQRPIHTTDNSKWIFVLSETKNDPSLAINEGKFVRSETENDSHPTKREVNFYVGEKVKRTFQHSSLLSRGSTSIAAGRVVVHHGILQEILPHRGNHLPLAINQDGLVKFLEQHLADLRQLKNVKQASAPEAGAPQTTDESTAPLMRRQRSSTSVRIEDDINNNQVRHNQADGFNKKYLFRIVFYITSLGVEIASAVLEYRTSENKVHYALIAMLLSIVAVATSLFQIVYTGVKEGVTWNWKGWIPWFYHPRPNNNIFFGNLVDVIGLLFSFFQCGYAIAAYHRLSHHHGDPPQFPVYSIILAFCLLCSKF